MPRLLRLLCLLVLSAPAAYAQQPFTPFASPDEAAMLEAWARGDAHRLPLGVAVLLAEGAPDSTALAVATSHLEALLQATDAHVRAADDPLRKARALFRHLHRDVLKQYIIEAPFGDLLRRGTYNCVSGTLLFALAAARHDIPAEVHLTPDHMYAVVRQGNRQVRVEMTDPRRGFAFKEDHKAVVRHLLAAKIVTPEDVEARGTQALYRELIEQARRGDEADFLYVTYYNQGVFAYVDDEPERALTAFGKALRLRPDDEAAGLSFESAFGEVIRRRLQHPADLLAPTRYALDVRGGSDSFVAVLLPLLRALTIDASEQRDLAPALDLLAHARTRLTAAEAQTALDQTEAAGHYNMAAAAYNLGHYADARTAIRRAFALWPEDARIAEGYVIFSTGAAVRHAQEGHHHEALAQLDSLRDAGREIPAFRAAYAGIVADAVRAPGGLLRQDRYAEAQELIQRAHAVAPAEPEFIRTVEAVYHEWAMQQVRSKQYAQARSTLDEGLRIAANSTYLREAQDIVDQFERNRW